MSCNVADYAGMWRIVVECVEMLWHVGGVCWNMAGSGGMYGNLLNCGENDGMRSGGMCGI